jgi:hypothetical protein
MLPLEKVAFPTKGELILKELPTYFPMIGTSSKQQIISIPKNSRLYRI